jgi:hypothetical protein
MRGKHMDVSLMHAFTKSLTRALSLLLVCVMLTTSFASTANARFVSPDDMDPTMQGVGTNRYAYSGNDPVNKSDPNGHIWGVVAGIIGAFFGGTTYSNAPGKDEAPVSESDSQQLTNMATGAAGTSVARNVVKELFSSKKEKKGEATTAGDVDENLANADETVRQTNDKAAAGVNTDGKIYSRTITMNGNTYAVEAETSISGNSVTLNNLNINKIGDSSSISPGTFNAVRSEIAKEFRSLGFDRATVNGVRISGANPGRYVSFEIDLTRY